MLNVGHSHPEVIQAVQEQATRFLHTDFTVIPYEGYVELAERLLAVSPFRGPAKAAFFNAGTEAVENAVKFARALHGPHRRRLLRRRLSRPDAAVADHDLEDAPVQGGPRPVRAGGLPAPVPRLLPRPEPARGARGARALVRRRIVPPETRRLRRDRAGARARAASCPPRRSTWTGCASFCDRHGIVLVADEVQTGFGRTGKMWAVEHYGIEPDLMTVAKSIAAGLPLSGVLGKAEIMDAPAEGGVGGTYVGNPVALAAALAVLDVFEDEGLVERAAEHRRDDARADARAGRSATTRSATCAASARCSRSSSSATGAPRRRRRSSRRA